MINEVVQDESLFALSGMFVEIFDSALLEHRPGLEGLVRLLHAVFEFFEHLLPAIWVGSLVLVHCLDEGHVEVCGAELALL